MSSKSSATTTDPRNAKTTPAMRPRYESMDAIVSTELLQLTPDFLNALKKVGPKKRMSKIPFVVGFAVVAIIGALGIDKSTREFGVAKGQQLATSFNEPAAPAVVTSTPSEAVSAFTPAPAINIDEPVSTPVVNVAPAKTDKPVKAPTPAAAAKRPQPRSVVTAPTMLGRTAMLTAGPLTREL
jgi:hypothetical protein